MRNILYIGVPQLSNLSRGCGAVLGVLLILRMEVVNRVRHYVARVHRLPEQCCQLQWQKHYPIVCYLELKTILDSGHYVSRLISLSLVPKNMIIRK